MANVSDRVSESVLKLVTKELQKDSEAGNPELFEKAVAKHSSVKKLTLRQFNARFSLPAKRNLGLVKKGGRKKGGAAKTTKGRGGRKKAAGKATEKRRESYRSVLLEFAAETLESEGVPDFLRDLERYVDRIEEAGKA